MAGPTLLTSWMCVLNECVSCVHMGAGFPQQMYYSVSGTLVKRLALIQDWC